jgi:hypothetical protein
MRQVWGSALTAPASLDMTMDNEPKEITVREDIMFVSKHMGRPS